MCCSWGMHCGGICDGEVCVGGIHGGVHGRGCTCQGGMCGRGACLVGEGACVAEGVCVVGVCMAEGGMCDRGGACMVRVCMTGGMCGRGLFGRRDGHCSRQYASYWNAFLFIIFGSPSN